MKLNKILLIMLVVFASSAAFAQDSGIIVGWGRTILTGDFSGSFTAVSAKTGHCLGLNEDGSIAVWGSNYNGQFNVPAPNSGFIAVSAGRFHCLGLKADGSIVGWGDNGFGQCDVPSPNTGFSAISAGNVQSLGLKSDGTIVAWGSNNYGKCDIPAPNSGFTAISAGENYCLGLKSDGTIVAWGNNDYGQCDNPEPESSFIAISAGTVHCLALKSDGSIVAWGYNNYAQCNVPYPNADFVAICAADTHSIGLKSDGSVVCWGSEENGKCQVPSPNNNFIAIAAGNSSSFAIRKAPAFTLAPVFTPGSGLYTLGTQVKITCVSNNAVIHYTTNGVDPTESDPVIASGDMLTIDKPFTLKARAWKTGLLGSDIQAAGYEIDDGRFDANNILMVPKQYELWNALSEAIDGDTIVIEPGVYQQYYFSGIKKKITIQGINPNNIYIAKDTIIDFKGYGGFEVTAPAGEISGLAITNAYNGIQFYNYNYNNYNSFYIGCFKIRNCILRNNKGSGIYITEGSEIEIDGCIITNNSDSGIKIDYAKNTTVKNCIISNNETKSYGGGICANSVLKILNSKIINNKAFSGGGLNMGYRGYCTIFNSLIASNKADDSGGGCYTSSGYGYDIYNSDVVFNSSQEAPAINSDSPAIKNSIFWGNRTFDGDGWAFSDNAVIKNSCIENANLYFNAAYIADNNIISVNPGFVTMPDDGGDGWGDNTWTPDVNEGANDNYNSDFHLRPDSPCIDAGYINTPDFGTDLDGNPRVMGNYVDIGMYEFIQKSVTVSNPKEGSVWTCGSKRTIIWVAIGVDKVDIELSRNSGQSWYKIVRNINNTGSFLLTVPNFIWSKNCMLRVVPSNGIAGCEITPSEKFTIKPFWKEFRCSALWKSVGGDYDRDGQSDWFGAELKYQKWSSEVGGRIDNGITIGKWGYIHIPTEDGILYTINPYGSFCWSFDANEALYSAASIGNDGTIYVGSESGRLYAINSWGDVRWTQDVDGFIYSSPAVGKNDKVFYGSADGKIYAAGPDGSELWSFQTNGVKLEQGCVMASPSIGANGTVYVSGTYDANMYALDPNTGNIKWVYEFNEGDNIFASPVIGSDGTIYQVTVNDPNLYAIKPLDGSLKWKVNLDVNVPDANGLYLKGAYGLSEPVIDRNGTIYVSFDDNFLRAVRPNGTIKWIKDIGGTGGFTMTVDRFNRIYAAGEDGWVACFDSSGNQLSKFTANKRFSMPVILWNNSLAVSDSNDCAAYKTGKKNSVTTISKYNYGN